MRKPTSPPANALRVLMSSSPERFQKAILKATQSESAGKYLHWNILRHLAPPAGLTVQDWWAATKMVRSVSLKEIPLFDVGHRPFRYAMTETLSKRMHQIDMKGGGSIGMLEPIANPETRNRYIKRSLFEEALSSSLLEGAATTRAEAKKLLLPGRAPRTKGERMVLNNFQTMQRITEWKDRPLTPGMICELQRIVTDGTLDDPAAAGRIRTAQETVVVENLTGDILHRPPTAEEIPERMEELCSFANGETPENPYPESHFIHPAVRAILLHFWLAYDHPFVDGNGRTARALFYWSMLRQGYWLFEFVSISRILLQAPAQYALAFLHTETDENDLTYFLHHQTEVIHRAIIALHEHLTEKEQELRSAEHLLRDLVGLNLRQQLLIGHSLRHPGKSYTIEGHRSWHGIVYQTARQDLLDLQRDGWLEMRKVGNAFIFSAPADLAERVNRKNKNPAPTLESRD